MKISFENGKSSNAKKLPSAKILHELLTYDPETGKLYWKPRSLKWFRDGTKFGKVANCQRWNTVRANQEAFTAIERRRGEDKGYAVGILLNVRYKAHRIIYKMCKGKDPAHIDHIDGDSSNNRIENLRSVSQKTNSRNQKLRSTNTSGVSGVRWNKDKNRWIARIKVDYEHVNIGSFLTLDEAEVAVRAAWRKYGFHKNHGEKR